MNETNEAASKRRARELAAAYLKRVPEGTSLEQSKEALAQFLKRNGVRGVLADAVAHDLLGSGQEIVRLDMRYSEETGVVEAYLLGLDGEELFLSSVNSHVLNEDLGEAWKMLVAAQFKMQMQQAQAGAELSRSDGTRVETTEPDEIVKYLSEIEEELDGVPENPLADLTLEDPKAMMLQMRQGPGACWWDMGVRESEDEEETVWLVRVHMSLVNGDRALRDGLQQLVVLGVHRAIATEKRRRAAANDHAEAN